MDTLIGIQGCGRYDALRRRMQRLQEEFNEAAFDYPALGHQLISPLDGPLSKQQWSAFKKVNSQTNGEWQEWDDFPGGESCGRFFGNEISLSSFVRMAEDGMTVLAEMGRLTEQRTATLPADLLLRLPPHPGHHGWLHLLYQTARCYPTAFLCAEPGCWGCTGQYTGSEDSEWHTVEGVRVPLQPFYEELRFDLFQSSAQAIRFWLDPTAAFILSDSVADTPICLPPEPERNGPAPPDAFWLHGTKYAPFSAKPWVLLNCLWGKESLSMEEAINQVYGPDAEERETAIVSVQKRLSAELDARHCPAEVHRKNGGFVLEVFRQG